MNYLKDNINGINVWFLIHHCFVSKAVQTPREDLNELETIWSDYAQSGKKE